MADYFPDRMDKLGTLLDFCHPLSPITGTAYFCLERHSGQLVWGPIGGIGIPTPDTGSEGGYGE